MTETTLTKKEISKEQAKMALRILTDYYNLVINPHYEAKRDALPQKKNYDRIDLRYQSRSIQAHSALITIEIEIRAMPDDNQ